MLGKTNKPVNSKSAFICQGCVSHVCFICAFFLICQQCVVICCIYHMTLAERVELSLQPYDHHHHQPSAHGPPPAHPGRPGLACLTLPLPWPLAPRALGGGCSCVAIKHAVSIQAAPLTMCQQHGSMEAPRPWPSPRPGALRPFTRGPRMRRVCVGVERERERGTVWVLFFRIKHWIKQD